MNQSPLAVSDVHAAELRPGDGILRSTVTGGHREMVIDDIDMRYEAGQSMLLFTGSTYALDPGTDGGRISGPALGEDCWISPIDAKVWKVTRRGR
jgi:hypothetical protein